MVRHHFNENVHGLRGISILLVFIHHVYVGAETYGFFPLAPDSALSRMLDAAQYGVELFFIISGFLITDSILRHRSVLSFLKDRVVRIYPAFLAVFAVLALAGWFAGLPFMRENPPATLWALLAANLLLLPGLLPLPILLGVAWSLSYEWGFYLFAASARVASGRSRIFAPLLLVAVAACLLWIYPRAVFFLVGAMVFFRHGGIAAEPNPTRLYRRLSPLGLPLLLAGLAAWATGWDQMTDATATGPGTMQAWLWLATGLALTIPGFDIVARGPATGGSLLRCRWILFLGTISYSLYLWHTLVMFVTKRLSAELFSGTSETLAVGVFALSSALVSIPLSWLSYAILERRAGTWLRQQWFPPTTVRSAAE